MPKKQRPPTALPAPHPDDLAAFHAAVADAQPLKPQNRVQLKAPSPPPWVVSTQADERAALNETRHTPIGLQDRLEGGDEPSYLRPSLAKTILKDLRRGRWVVQDEIDLHGYTRDQARSALAEFLANALAEGSRCVRIVHGKGLSSPGKTSILRQLVRGWLTQREEILAYCQAKPQDGGEGALIALLRAARHRS